MFSATSGTETTCEMKRMKKVCCVAWFSNFVCSVTECFEGKAFYWAGCMEEACRFTFAHHTSQMNVEDEPEKTVFQEVILEFEYRRSGQLVNSLSELPCERVRRVSGLLVEGHCGLLDPCSHYWDIRHVMYFCLGQSVQEVQRFLQGGVLHDRESLEA